ncbi:MAG: acyl carrier protein [Candidatus Omnitrophica bacterium]|nr:acyl carrier protein [Candidatus Omnitrophota bacterium]
MSKFNRIVSKVLKIKASRITDRTSPINVKSWDSFRGLLLITEIEKGFGVKFSMQEILTIKDIASLKKILKSHGINPDEA